MFIAIDVGGTKTSFALADESGRMLTRFQSASGLYNGAWLDVLSSGIDHLLQESNTSLKQIKRIAVGAPSLRVRAKEVPTTLPMAIKISLSEKYGIPVLVDNDAVAAALGELYQGAGKGKRNFLFMIVGTGIGGAVIKEGKIYRGDDGRAGEFGHMSIDPNGQVCGCGEKGCLHLYASGFAIAKKALQKIAEKKDTGSKILRLAGSFKEPKELAKKITAEIVVRAAGQGDQTAREVLAESLTYLGQGIVKLIERYNPESLIIGGGLAEAGDLFFAPLKKIVAQLVKTKLEIVPAALGAAAGLVGAIELAKRG